MSKANEMLVILLHGVGSDGADMARIGAIWAKTIPHITYVAPDGIMAGPGGHGRAWFSILGVTDENRPDRIIESRPAFDALLKSVIAKAGFEDHLERVVLVGFSQGSMMALDAAVSGRWPVAGVLAFSGRLATRAPFAPSSTRIRLVHGDADPVISVIETRKADQLLKTAGFAVDTTLLANLGHTISGEGLDIGRQFITSLASAKT